MLMSVPRAVVLITQMGYQTVPAMPETDVAANLAHTAVVQSGEYYALSDTFIVCSDHVSTTFALLKKQWHNERGATSSSTKSVMCPAYQKIIGMGADVVPLILADLNKNVKQPDHWFWALNMITREDPIPVDFYGRHVKMAEAWLTWGEERNLYIAGRAKTSRTLQTKTVS